MIEAVGGDLFQRALFAGTLASVAAGVVGTYVVVKGFASISGGVAHASFGGVGLGLLLGFDPILGAAGFALLSGLGIAIAYRRLGSGLETLVMIVWAVGMALGFGFVAAVPGETPHLEGFLFGDLFSASPRWLWLTAAFDLALLATVTLYFRGFQGVAFDEEFAEIVGVRVNPLILVLFGLISLAVVLLIRVVGVLLAIALLTIPAALARQWSATLRGMMVLATATGAASILAGLFLSRGLSGLLGFEVPAGPAIVVVAALAFGASSATRGASPDRA